MSATLPAKRSARPNLDGGRPVRPEIHEIERVVEAIVALKDDGTLFRRSAITEAHCVSHIEDAHHAGNTPVLLRATAALRRLIREKADRAQRLFQVVIPEVQAEYRALETAVAG